MACRTSLYQFLLPLLGEIPVPRLETLTRSRRSPLNKVAGHLSVTRSACSCVLATPLDAFGLLACPASSSPSIHTPSLCSRGEAVEPRCTSSMIDRLLDLEHRVDRFLDRRTRRPSSATRTATRSRLPSLLSPPLTPFPPSGLPPRATLERQHLSPFASSSFDDLLCPSSDRPPFSC